VSAVDDFCPPFASMRVTNANHVLKSGLETGTDLHLTIQSKNTIWTCDQAKKL